MDVFITIPYNCIWNLSEKARWQDVPAEIKKQQKCKSSSFFYNRNTTVAGSFYCENGFDVSQL